MVYVADAARFTECLTGRSYPIAHRGDFVTMQRAYLKGSRSPALVFIDLRRVDHGPPANGGLGCRTQRGREQVHQRLAESEMRVSPGECFADQHLLAHQQHRWPPCWPQQAGTSRIFCSARGSASPYAATIGCNQLVGSYTLAGESIALPGGPPHLTGCLPPLDALEKRLGQALARTKRWQIKGNTLEFMDETGSQIALFEAVYL